jgi:GTP-binding protein Era
MPNNHHSGFIAILGRSNVGKSTLLNILLGQKIAPVSPRPQTTRKTQLGILTLDNAQLIFIDTPGVHQPRHKLGEKMNFEAQNALEDCDLILFMVDITSPPTPEDLQLADKIKATKTKTPVILVANKIDQIDRSTLPTALEDYQSLLPLAAVVAISATNGENLEQLLSLIISRLPEGPPFYPVEQITDLNERELAAELIREACLYILRDEVPHGISVRIDQYIEREGKGAYIEATIFVERQSHKGIVIGQGGLMLKQIGTRARQEIEMLTSRKIYLQLRVKVRNNWRNDEKMLRWLGY